jgi:hypothetical protein
MAKITPAQQRFKEAFIAIHNRGLVPTVTKLNDELDRARNDLNGRETKLRSQLMLGFGYTKDEVADRWRRPLNELRCSVCGAPHKVHELDGSGRCDACRP